ncbi:M23 family metallopeptidase [Nocardia sp. MW-W600-9]
MPMAEGSYTLTSGFGMRWGTNHQGQDFAAASKTPIYAVADGLVVRVGAASGFGIWVVIDHNIDGETVSSVYGHMFADDVRVEQGQNVRIGQLIAGCRLQRSNRPPRPGRGAPASRNLDRRRTIRRRYGHRPDAVAAPWKCRPVDQCRDIERGVAADDISQRCSRSWRRCGGRLRAARNACVDRLGAWVAGRLDPFGTHDRSTVPSGAEDLWAAWG